VRIDYAIPVRSIEPLADGTLALIVTTDILIVESLPAPVVVPLAISISGDQYECVPEVEHEVEGRILDSQLVEIGAMRGGVTMAPGPNTPPGWDVRLQMPIVLRFLAEDYGTYSVELSIDKSSLSIPIIVQAPPEAAPED
jgi:hypothetical protein